MTDTSVVSGASRDLLALGSMPLPQVLL